MGRKTIEYRDPASLTPYENNPRDNGASVPRVAESIREFGFQAPIIVDADGVIIAGHTRLKATFPLYLPTQMAETFTNPGESVYDPFGGTGTTMIACEQTGRRCRMMELEPRYCDVIIARWEKATGKKAELMEGS